jgi:branched-subunit amino acid ABC-type transport system permease component
MKDVFPYIVMLLVLIFKPYGLFGLVRIERI